MMYIVVPEPEIYQDCFDARFPVVPELSWDQPAPWPM